MRGGERDRDRVEKINGGATANKPRPTYLLVTGFDTDAAGIKRVVTEQTGNI